MKAAKPFAREIEAYTDEELDRYLVATKRFVSVQDPENLSEQFIHRLRDRSGPLETAPSRPVDLDQVSARLLQISNRPPPPRGDRYMSNSESVTPPSAEEQYATDLRLEREFHDEFVADGGRPWYPIHLLDDVSKNPRKYHELLRYWQGDFPDENQDFWCVFGCQLCRWDQFRDWQGRMRKRFANDLPLYMKRTKKTLAKQSFTQDFQFHEDPRQQDKLATWIEYLSYECVQYARYSWYKRREKAYNEAWEKLVDSIEPRPHETQEYLESVECGWQRRSEGTKLEQAMEAAKSAVSQAQEVMSSQPSSSARRKLETARSELDAATQSFESFMKRNGHIEGYNHKTSNYREAKRSGERHILLLQWIRDQVPLIESELKHSKAAEGIKGVGHVKEGRTKRGRDEAATENRDAKRQKRGDGGESSFEALNPIDPPEQTQRRRRGEILAPVATSPSRSRRAAHDNARASPSVGDDVTAARGEESGEQDLCMASTSNSKRKRRNISSDPDGREAGSTGGPDAGNSSKRDRSGATNEGPNKRLRRRVASAILARDSSVDDAISTAEPTQTEKFPARKRKEHDDASSSVKRRLRRSARTAARSASVN